MAMEDRSVNIEMEGGAEIEEERWVEEINTGPMIDDLIAACTNLGKADLNDGTYMKSRDCKACLKDIIRALHRDTKQHVIRCILGSMNIIKSDLIPIVIQYCDYNDGDSDLFTLILRLLTNLTSSLLLLFENQEVPTDPDSMKVFNKLRNGLVGYKDAFANEPRFWDTLNTHLRHTDEEIPFERLIILLRNILLIPVDSSADFGMHNSFDTHGLCLYRMQQSGILHTIIEIASGTQKGTDFCFHIMEIVYLMLREQNPVTVASARQNTNKRKLEENDTDRKRLAELSARDKREREMRDAKFVAPRFKNSLFLVKNCRSLSDNNLLSRTLIVDRKSMTFDAGKTELRKSKNRKPLSSETSSTVVSDRNTKPTQVTYSLKLFSKMFVEKVYANYMQQIKHNLIQKKAAENDESYYLWAIQYFTAFCMHLHMNLDFISETMSTSTLHFIQILITSYQDKIKIEKKRSLIEHISKRLHLALRAYREILYLIKSIEEGSDFWNTIETIKKNIFTELEYNSLLLTLFQQYDESKHCPEYLKDLIQTNDVFLELLEHYSKTHNPVLITEGDEDEPEEDFNSAETAESRVVAESLENNEEGLKNTENLIETGELWDTEEPRETEEQKTNEETLEPEQPAEPIERTDSEKMIEAESPIEAEELKEQLDRVEGLDIISESAEEKKKKTKKKKKGRKKQQELRSTHFVSRYCSPDVIKAYLDVLRDFRSNDSDLNLYVLKFFERVVHDCRSETMLLQASLLRCLLDINDYHPSMPGYEGFVSLTKHLMSTFGSMVNKKRWMIQELLFWKTYNDVIEIENAVDPPPPPPPVVASPTPNMDELEADIENQDDNQEHIDPLEELMAELGSDSSVAGFAEAADNQPDAMATAEEPANGESDMEALLAELNDDSGDQTNYASTKHNSMDDKADDDVDDTKNRDESDSDNDDEIVAPVSRSARRTRLSSDSDESKLSEPSPPSHVNKIVYDSDNDDLSSPPSPVPTPEIVDNLELSDMPAANEDRE